MENKKLKKKLTPELLSLILGKEVEEVKGIMGNTLYYNLKNNRYYINLDTLTIKMMDFIKSKNFIVNLYSSRSVMGWVFEIDSEKYIGELFDVVLDATQYVAKQIKE